MAEHAEVIVIGGGQAGLTAGYYLSQARIPFLILDADTRAGNSWRRRWDSRTYELPIRHGARVTSLERCDGGYRAVTGPGQYEAAQVIISAGAYQRPACLGEAGQRGDPAAQLRLPQQAGRW